MTMLAEPVSASREALSANAAASLFEALAGLRNRRAVVALLGCAVVGVVVASLVASMAGTLGGLALLMATLVWFVAIGTGVNAAGVLQMDEARRISPRSTVDALVYGLMCIPKVIVLFLAALAVEIVVFIAIALLLLLCKIPFLGPLLFVAVFPLSVLAAGITVVGVLLFMVLSLPAVWQGAAITRAVAQAWAIVHSRLVEAVLVLLALGLLCAVAAFVVFGVLGAGLVPTLGLSASILSFGGFDLGGVGAGLQSGGGSYATAGVIGGLLLWAVAGSLVGQVYLRGLSLAYLRLTDGLDLGAAEDSLRATFDEARRRTAQMSEKARRAAQREPEPTAASANAAATPLAAAAPGRMSGYEPSPLFNPPPAYSPPPQTVGTADAPADIDLSFDDTPTPGAPAMPAMPLYAAPPAWAPPPAAAPAVAELRVEPAAATACPQCLSPITGDDVFCGVCGYRLK
ncbi:MAG: zinc ribbon domain-containing protein [Caldimonas sp.]